MSSHFHAHVTLGGSALAAASLRFLFCLAPPLAPYHYTAAAAAAAAAARLSLMTVSVESAAGGAGFLRHNNRDWPLGRSADGTAP